LLGIGGLVLVAASTLTVVSITTGEPPAPMQAPSWAAIFSTKGKVLDLQGGVEAIFSPDKISNGAGIDNTIFPNPANPKLIDNGTVGEAHDLGNAYFWVNSNAAGNRLLHAGVERLATNDDSFVEFEFNKGVVRVTTGAPWPIRGQRQEGDLLVRIDLRQGAIDAASFKTWDGEAFRPLLSAGPDGCSGSAYRYCLGAAPIQSVPDETWDAAGNILQPRQPDRFLEIGLDLNALLGSNVEFTSIQVRTPGDAIMDSFRRMGQWAHANQGGGQ
jgi:hypothetical protein